MRRSARIADTKPVDQLGLLYDTWALGEAGYSPVTNYLDLVRAMPPAADSTVWLQIVSVLTSIHRYYDGNPGQAEFTTFARAILQPLVERLGWDPHAGEDPNAVLLRSSVLAAMGRFGDEAVIAEARRRFDVTEKNPAEVSPAVRRTALSIVAQHADAGTLDRLIGAFRATQGSLQKQEMLRALAGVADAKGAQRVLDLAVEPGSATGAGESTLLTMASRYPDLAWNFAMEHIDRPGLMLDSIARMSFMPEIASRSSDPKRVADLQKYADEHIPASSRENVVSAIATMKQGARFRAERIPEIDRWLAVQAGR